MKTILAFVTLHTPDYPAARAYFTEVLGFEPTEERPGANAFVQASGAGLAIREDREARPPLGVGVTAYFIVPDLENYHTQLARRGAEIVEPPHDMPFGRTFTVKTPDGHRLGFYEA
ncbi:VOC family protein [Deinococcus metallilatus]|uniref:Enzyme related to lactoylglutathione lyase n=1 Tax=Deinococcus metallilatus TaxID=1211322 RepID=A0AAJ5F6L9_9DEIO|nr:VOC family protein [Deinococcus metallilatus]MBB5294628.1 putative enzyme related to lactoylglutathione lyase [Deinococcus metallilatus]QBY07665.1 VOC family protein [Deinococcus metallilatus]RXJ14081.1 VOC family protein [Deinococcus metallilatus]TLK30046.1 VOC family protein [Deinococcus metallilatus]GMA15841.1 glyoxalase [Deinococcus metallilatus]